MELVPEVYLDEVKITQQQVRDGIERLIRETAGYLLSLDKKDVTIGSGQDFNVKNVMTKSFKLTDICNIERKYAPYLNELLSDHQITPYVTTRDNNNGIAMRCDTDSNFERGCITVALDGTCGTTFYQFENFIAGEKTAVLTLRDVYAPNPYMLFYLAYLIRYKSWRYHYGRKLSMGRLQQLEISMPVDRNENIDTEYIRKLVRSCYGWEIIEAYL